MPEVYLGLGSNIGDKAANLRAALRLLKSKPRGQPGGSLRGAARLSPAGRGGHAAADFQAGPVPQAPAARLLAVSSLYWTDPIGYLDQDWFLNVVARIETQLSPRELLTRLIAIERKLGRVRTVRNGPRIIDLDILLWQDLIVREADLVIPHPRLHERLFVLEPLAEIAPDARHPVLGISIADCLAEFAAGCKDVPGVFRIEGPKWADGLIQ